MDATSTSRDGSAATATSIAPSAAEAAFTRPGADSTAFSDCEGRVRSNNSYSVDPTGRCYSTASTLRTAYEHSSRCLLGN